MNNALQIQQLDANIRVLVLGLVLFLVFLLLLVRKTDVTWTGIHLFFVLLLITEW